MNYRKDDIDWLIMDLQSRSTDVSDYGVLSHEMFDLIEDQLISLSSDLSEVIPSE